MPGPLEYDEEDAYEDDSTSLFGSPEPESEPSASSRPTSNLHSPARIGSPGGFTTFNPVQPIASSSGSSTALHRPPSSGIGVGRGGGGATGSSRLVTNRVTQAFEERQTELRLKRASSRSQPERNTGVPSLRAVSISVLREYATLVRDIGDMDYPLVAEVIDDLPADQLAELETNCPHIRHDTDWLWESFLLSEFPLFHERCKEKHGEPRTSGWRRMYKKAKEEAIEKQQQAVDRVAERYRQLDEERKARRIVVLDKVVSSKHARVGSRSAPAPRSGGGSHYSGGSTPSRSPSASSAIAKARTDAQRARVALTHASGRYLPPTPSSSRSVSAADASTAAFRNPYLPTSSSGAVSTANSAYSRSTVASRAGSRSGSESSVQWPVARKIKAPTSRPRPVTAEHMSRDREAKREPDRHRPTSPTRFEGSYQTNPSQRADLPRHLLSTSTPPTSTPAAGSGTTGERFKINPEAVKAKSTARIKSIHKPQIENFDAPKPKPQSFDYFAPRQAVVSNGKWREEREGKEAEKKRRGEDGGLEEKRDGKRSRKEVNDTDDFDGNEDEPAIGSITASTPSGISGPGTPSSPGLGPGPARSTRPGPTPAEAKARIESVLFRKKKPLVGSLKPPATASTVPKRL